MSENKQIKKQTNKQEEQCRRDSFFVFFCGSGIWTVSQSPQEVQLTLFFLEMSLSFFMSRKRSNVALMWMLIDYRWLDSRRWLSFPVEMVLSDPSIVKNEGIATYRFQTAPQM
jgi:hypothetical protein